MNIMKPLLCLFCMLTMEIVLSEEVPSVITHAFLALDESRKQLIYVDEQKPENNWCAKNIKSRDMQLIGRNRLLLSTEGGYMIFNLVTKQIEKKVTNVVKAHRVESICMDEDGVVYVTSRGAVVTILSPDDAIKTIITMKPPFNKNLRLMRRTNAETFLFGRGNTIVEMNTNGELVWTQVIQGARHLYKGARLENGNTLISAGYGSFLAEVQTDGEVVRSFGGQGTHEELGINPHFYADFNLLVNGHVVVCNWLGHDTTDSEKGKSLVEYDEDGKVVWTWTNPALSGSLHAVIIMDNKEPDFFYREVNGVLIEGELK